MTPRGVPPESPVTARAVAIGLVGAVALNLLMNFSDYYLNNTLLIGNHFPTAGMAALLFLTLAVNGVARRVFRLNGLAPGELLLVWGMIGVAGGVGAAGFMRYFPGWAAGPAYFATPSNDYAKNLVAQVPSWLLVGARSGEADAARWFFEGLPRGRTIPWGAWARPGLAWGGFILLISAAMFAFVALFFRQWVDRERLIFPIVHVPLEVARPPLPGKGWNEFLGNRLVWFGAAVPISVLGINGLRTYFPALPAIPLFWSGAGLFPDRPWSELSFEEIHVYFSIIGLTFLLTTEVAFSLVFFYVAYRFSYVGIAWLGTGATGYWGNWAKAVSAYQSAGAAVTIAALLAFSARADLRARLRRLVRGEDRPEADLLPPWLAFGLLVLGVGGTFGWLVAARMSWGAALGTVVVMLSVMLVLTRIVAEAGLLLLASNALPYDLLTGLVPAGAVSGPTLAVAMLLKGLFHDAREILMPFLVHGVRACEAVRMRGRRVLAVLAVTYVVALLGAGVGRIATCYKYGGVNGDDWANNQSQHDFIEDLNGYLVSPPSYDWLKVGGVRILPVGVAHVLTGAAVVGALFAARAVWPWWPFHPFGFLVCGTFSMTMLWSSILLGGAAKWAVMTLGGATTYRRWLPFFLGLVLGESLIAVFWVVTSLATGRPGIWILPN